MNTDKITFYALNVSPLCDTRLFAAAYALLPQDRQKKLDSLRQPSDRRLSAGAGLLLGRLLSERGIQGADILTGKYGKPYVGDGSVYFSLSHSGEYALCAGGGMPLGCDIERIGAVNMNLPKRFFTPREYAHIASMPTEAERSALFFRYWTRKESFIKAVGAGLNIPLNSFETLLDDGADTAQSYGGRTYRFAEYGGISGYACALCTADVQCDAALRVLEVSELLC